MKKTFSVLCCLMMLFAASTAWGHMLWLNVDNHQPRVGDSVRIEIGWGHKFPTDAAIKQERLKRVYAVDPEGRAVSLKQTSTSQYKLTVKQEGVYLVCAEINPGFYTKTTDGYKMQTKKGLDNAIKCVSFDMRAKALINVGAKNQGLLREVDDLLEIIPQQSPAKLAEGDLLQVKVLYQGKPLARAYLYATYAGFSEAKETYAFTTMTDREGRANVKLIKKGVWLVKMPHKIPYPDPEECDQYSYCSTLTFEVK